MDEEKKEMLEVYMRDQVRAKLEQMSKIQLGSKEHAAAAKDITELYKAVTAELNAEYEYEEFGEKLEAEKEKLEFEKQKFEAEQQRLNEELELRKEQLAFEKQKFEEENKKYQLEAERTKIEDIWDKVWKGLDLTVKVACVMLPLRFYARWMEAGLEFEKTGTFTSAAFRGLFGKFKPNKVD